MGYNRAMQAWLADQHPVLSALLATLFTWAMTAAGAALVFVTPRVNRKLLDSMLGFAAGVMIAASFWSLLAPGIEIARRVSSLPAWLPALIGFALGGAAVGGLDKALPHLHPSLKGGQPEGPRASLRRAWLLVIAVTIHNIPEGLAVGVAFGGAAWGLEAASIGAAVALAFGIGIQNLPEGVAVAMPLRGEGWPRGKSFLIGQASGMVEPIAGVLGALAVAMFQPMLPYAYAFAAGAMIYVVVEELIPESQSAGNVDLATVSTLAGFAVMMCLDVALG